MATSKTRKEKTVIAFFALVLVVVVAMAIIDPKPPERHEEHDESAQSAPIADKIAEAKARLDVAPNNVHALILLGDLYMDNKQIKEALNIFNRALKIEPQNTHVLSDLAAIYQQSGFYEKSLGLFNTVIDIEPNNLSAIYNLGMLHRYYKKDNKEALKYYEKLLSQTTDPQLLEWLVKEIESTKADIK